MALSYAKGPTLESLLKTGGKLSLHFARVVTAQLVDAITYLHSRAVIYRDIKPDNLIITGATKDQGEIWDDDPNDTKNPDWETLLKKWHVTLVDFGFARALTPADMKKKLPPQTASKANMDSSLCSLGSSGTSKSRRGSALNRSMSRRFTRKMSAVGTRKYAAPEVTKNIEKNLDPDLENNNSKHLNVDVTKTLSDHVSYYGLLVDAYSVGNNIKYMLTGVPPDEDVNEAIAAQNHPVAKLGRFLGKKMGKKAKPDAVKQRKIKYRPFSKIPPEVVRLIKGCTHFDPHQRTSIRMARMYPWIDDVLEGRDLPDSRQVTYLNFVIQAKDEVKGSSLAALQEPEPLQDDEVESEGITI
jgi:serine/threonine protein kinase